jgi:hypothetical protein
MATKITRASTLAYSFLFFSFVMIGARALILVLSYTGIRCWALSHLIYCEHLDNTKRKALYVAEPTWGFGKGFIPPIYQYPLNK